MKRFIVSLAFVLFAQVFIAGTAWGDTTSCIACHGTHDSCFDCHAGGPDPGPHHSTDNASTGNCEYCHADPRSQNLNLTGWDVAGPGPGDNGNNYWDPTGSLYAPTQLACKECHVSFSGGKMIITKFTRGDYRAYTNDYTKTAQHTIENPDLAALGRINNYGICFSCHNGITATAVRIWHARPDVTLPGNPKDTTGSWVYNQDNAERCTGGREGWTFEYFPVQDLSLARYLPGRTSGTIGRFNLFNKPGFGYIPGQWDYGPCGDAGEYQSTPLNFKRITIPGVNGNGNTTGSVPVFPSLCRMTPEGEVCTPPPPPNNALPGDYSFTFNYTGSVETLEIPANATNLQFTVKGAGGGGGRPDNVGAQKSGSPGNKVVVPYATTGDTLKIYVGGGGKMGSGNYVGAAGGWGYPAGSKGGNGDEDGEEGWAYGGAGGGGASAIYNGTMQLAAAKGGSGGKSDDWDDYDYFVGGSGGVGGGSNYYPAGTVSSTGGGVGGTTAPTNGGNGQVVITYKVLP